MGGPQLSGIGADHDCPPARPTGRNTHISDEHEDLDDEAAHEARTLEFIRLLMGKALDVYDVEVHPPTATSGPTITVDDDVCQALEERAARSGMTVQELVEAGLGSAMLDFEFR
jgi:hypothetical protein